VTIEAALDANRTHGTGIGRLTPQHLILTLAVDLDAGHIEVKTLECSAQGLTLGGHEDSVSCLLDLIKVFRWLGPLPPPAPNILKVIHGGRIAGHKALVL
jgi:hypothetical protein